MSNKVFWQQAMKGGSVIGAAVIVISILRLLISPTGALNFLFGLLNIAVFVYLVYYFTKQLSRQADPAVGFTYARGIGFSVAMMLFAGVLIGLYNYVLNAFIAPEAMQIAIEESMAMVENIMPYNQVDGMYDMMVRMMTNPFFLIFSSVFGYVFYGVIVGLIVAALTKRDPNIFVEDNSGNE